VFHNSNFSDSGQLNYIKEANAGQESFKMQVFFYQWLFRVNLLEL